MTPTHVDKKGARYRYYVLKTLVRDGRGHAPRGRRIPAADLETIVEDRVVQFLRSEIKVFSAIEGQVADAHACADIVARAVELADRWGTLAPTEKRAILLVLIERIDVQRESLDIRIRPDRLSSVLDVGEGAEADGDGGSITFTVPARLKRAELENRLLIAGNDAQAHRYRALVMQGGDTSISELAAEAGIGGSYFTRALRLALLAPDITSAILHDRHPIDLTAKRLVNDVRLPLDWEDQRTLLGID